MIADAHGLCWQLCSGTLRLDETGEVCFILVSKGLIQVARVCHNIYELLTLKSACELSLVSMLVLTVGLQTYL